MHILFPWLLLAKPNQMNLTSARSHGLIIRNYKSTLVIKCQQKKCDRSQYFMLPITPGRKSRDDNSHPSDVTWASWCLKSSVSELFVKNLKQKRKYRRSPHITGPNEKEQPGTDGFSLPKGSDAEKISMSWLVKILPWCPTNGGIGGQ